MNVFEELGNELNKVLSEEAEDLNAISQLLERYIKLRNKYKAKLERGLELPSKSNQRFKELVKEKIIQEGSELLLTNALEAIEVTEEFNLPIFISAITQAIRDERTYKVNVYDSGKVNVKLDLRTTGGTLDDYFVGVQAYRDAIASDKFHTDPDNASRFWRIALYSTAREGKQRVYKRKKDQRIVNLTAHYTRLYYSTIQGRQQLSPNPAAFWNIVNYGTPGGKWGWGGYAYPKFAGTNFLENTEDLLKNKANEIYAEVYELLLEEAKKELEVTEQIIKEIDSIIGQLESFLVGDELTYAVNIFTKKLDSLGVEVDKVNLFDIVDKAMKFVEGTYFGTSGERVTIGGKRFRTVQMRKEFENWISSKLKVFD